MTSDLVAETLRSLDLDRYRASLILPQAVRCDVQAVYAAVAEISVIGERINEPMAGEIRLTWWADLLSGNAHGDSLKNPIAAALLDVVARYRLPVEPLRNLIEARRFDLYADPMPDVATFEGYAGETISMPIQLAATLLNGGATLSSGDAAGHLGVALAYFGHLKAFGYNASRNKLFLPLSMFEENGVTIEDIFSRRDSSALRSSLRQCRTLGLSHLTKARAALTQMPRNLRPAFAQIAMIDERAERERDPFAMPRPNGGGLKMLRLMWFGARLG